MLYDIFGVDIDAQAVEVTKLALLLKVLEGEPPAQTALEACAAIAMGRGSVATLPRDGAQRDDAHPDTDERPDRPALAVERDGFDLHAGVRIEAGDDLGRERLARYGARPPLSLERLRRLRGGACVVPARGGARTSIRSGGARSCPNRARGAPHATQHATAGACVEGIDFPRTRELDEGVVRTLATCPWVTEHQTVIITGATGTGKSYIACALAQQACRKGLRALYRRVPRLFDELRLARADGTYPRLLARLAKTDVLVLDDFAIAPLTDEARRDLLEILEDRYGLRATVITSQLDPDLWHDHLADPTVADAICDRVLHGAHRLALKGPSRRKTKEGTATD